MNRPGLMLALALSLAACSNEPGNGALVGDWGGESMAVSATFFSVTLTFPCGASVRIPHPVALDEVGRFTVLDSLRGSMSGGQRDTLPVPAGTPVVPALITGQVSGDSVAVMLTLNSALTAMPFTARRGTASNAGAVCRT